MSNKALKKVEKKVSLNIKVSEGLDERLKNARVAARAAGMQFNVSELISTYLERELKKVEKEFGIEVDKKAENKVKIDKKVESNKPEKVEINEEFKFPGEDKV
jgi:post-segregation antitoxin (ccd killing protein)